MEKEKVAIYKKWWFWLIVIVLVTIIVLLIFFKYREKQKIEETIKNIGEGATDYIEGIESANTHLNEFSYNYENGEVEYNPQITIEKYNQIMEGMTEKEVVNILGDGEKIQQEESEGFLMTWGILNLNDYPYYRIQITFDSSGKVSNKFQLGL